MRSGSDEFDRKDNAKKNANLLSTITFWYSIKTFIMGSKRDLDEFDLTEPLDAHKSSKVGESIAINWSKEVRNAFLNNRYPSLMRVISKTFRWEMIRYGFWLLFMEMVIRLPQPLFIGLFIRYFNRQNLNNTDPQYPPTFMLRAFKYFAKNQSRISTTEAYFFAGCIMTCSVVTILIFHPFIMSAQHIGMKVRVACCSLIYRKVLRLKLTALGGKTVGNTVNLMSNDVNRFDAAPLFLHYLWIAPLQGVIITTLIYFELGNAALFGIIPTVVITIVEILLSFATAHWRMQAGARTDERVMHMSELIEAIQVIKMYAWENAFIKIISNLRMKELKVLIMTSFVRGIFMTFIMITARIGLFLTILSYILMESGITVEQVFVIAGYYLILRLSCTVYFPQGLNAVAEAKASIKRIQEFLLSDETTIGDRFVLDPHGDAVIINEELLLRRNFQSSINTVRSDTSKLNKTANVTLVRGIAKYDESLCLNNINTNMMSGQLIAIVGPVGSGKTCLLNLILGELKLFSGKMSVNGVMSYACQEPWLFSGTVRQNILFGKSYDPERYSKTIRVCALRRDFSLLPYGDRTIVGERGISLSGGQRARINLARAVYKEADIYLFDDPLSAVDIQVGQQLFSECMLGHLNGKLVVLVTHQLQYLRKADKIIILNEGSIQIQGTYDEIKQSGVSLALLLEEAAIVTPTQADQEKEVDKVLKAISITSTAYNSFIDVEGLKAPPKMTPEMRTLGAVTFENYKKYFLAGANGCGVAALIGLFLTAQILCSGGDYFLSQWAHLEERHAQGLEGPDDFWDLDRTTCIYIYTQIMIGTIVVVAVRSLYFFSVCMRASYRLHNCMFSSVILAAMQFFHQNTSGRILNRFSKDMGQIDELLPNAFIDTVQLLLNLVGTTAIICTINPWFIIPMAFVLTAFYFLRRYYLKTSRSVKRLEGITRSPVFAHLNATLQGLPTIRVNNAERSLVDEFDQLQDIHSSCWFMFLFTSRAFSFWLDCITATFIGVVTFTCIIMSSSFHGSRVGLVITQALSLTGLIQWGMRQSAELENQMTSVERVLEFTKIEHEPDLESAPDKKPPANWPKKGQIEFINTTMRYSPHDAPVLKDLNIVILPKQKVGIVGRTGAGKSSLIITLFRLANFEGEIYVDHLDIGILGLHDLRRRISIIPQEPVLFRGTLRYNLDPFQEYSDQNILAALVAVEDKEAIAKGEASLDKVMTQGGHNISVGQRQMICLARAILRNNKILVMDEATANMDAQTDKLIQRTIRTRFAQCTVLTIAHRLHTVMDSDKILVMDAGRAVEFDHPHKLLQHPKGYLSELVKRTGSGTAAFLTKIARQNFEARQQVDRIMEKDDGSVPSSFSYKSSSDSM